MLLELPTGTLRVLLNIGSNLRPLLPPPNDTSVVSIAYEPIVASQIPSRERLIVVPAAVSDESGVMSMSILNKNGVSSSLASKHKYPSNLILGGAQRSVAVPVVTMSSVLGSIREGVAIWYLKTDMQGFDARALAASGSVLRRVHYVTAETYLLGVASYDGVANDFCRDLLPRMLEQSFIPLGLRGGRARWQLGPKDREFWQLCDTQLSHTKSNVTESWLFRSGGAVAAHAYCKRERLILAAVSSAAYAHRAVKESDAFFKAPSTKLPMPAGMLHEIHRVHR